MFLQVIWNNKLKQTSLIVSDKEINEDYQIILSFLLKEKVSTDFVQNFIAFKDFKLSYLEDEYFWLENISLTKNIISFFNIINIIDLEEKQLTVLDKFFIKQKLSVNDFDNLGFQSPIKTIQRDLSTQPKFMGMFLNTADVSKRLLRTTFDFIEDNINITINKRSLPVSYFLHHLNSNRDRLRINESLAYPFKDTENLIDYFSNLKLFEKKEPPLSLVNLTPEIQENISENLEDNISLVHAIDNNHNNTNEEIPFLDRPIEIEIPNQLNKELIKQEIHNLDLFGFINSMDLISDKQLEALEDFKKPNNFEDFFATERTNEEFPSLPDNNYIQEYDNSVYIEEQEETLIPTVVNDLVEEELTEDFLVEIETNLALQEKKYEKSISIIEDNEDEDLDETIATVSVEDLVDSINDIIEETFNLELIDIIELPLIEFLSDSIPEIKISDNFDNYFNDNDVNTEINTISAEEVLSVVNTEVSIFENIVIDKKKHKGKNKKNRILEDKSSLENSIKNQDNQSIDSTENIEYVSHNSEEMVTPEIRLEKSDSILLLVLKFIIDLEIRPHLLLHTQEKIVIVEFLLSASIVQDTPIEIIEESTSAELIENSNFNFFEDNQKKLIDLAMEGNIEEIDELYRNYPDFEKPLLNFNYQGDNPLCIASFNENLELLKKLIEFGWNPNYFDSNLNNALIIACAEGHKHIVKYLLTQELQINFQNKKGYTALHFAVNDCNHRIVKLLLDKGVDVDLSDNDRNTPLSIAAFKGDINSTKLLLQTRMNVHTKNKKGYDARSIALLAKNHAIAKLIEDKIVSEKHNHSLPPIIEKNI